MYENRTMKPVKIVLGRGWGVGIKEKERGGKLRYIVRYICKCYSVPPAQL
jgi:hypothetical protein